VKNFFFVDSFWIVFHVYDNEIFLAACFLDYKYKNFELYGDVNKSKANIKRIEAYLIDIYKSNIIQNGPSTSTQVGSRASFLLGLGVSEIPNPNKKLKII
jgi:hypothetical protein